ncbi:MAG: TetR/AcrR family transcriptional regulator [Clostridia bacterium]|nr:TetR/AcrR family transcriptional regulator [Clostridia bacterium]MBQ8717465.1 TetR/AcrR family transcriptional regulator [Clostridia bacterium]
MKIKNESNRLAKEYIVTALIELMKVRDYHSISITEITRKAGVSRMAYYRNYTSKEDILNKYMEEVGISIHEKISGMNTREEILDYYRELFGQLGAYRDLGITAYRAHLGELILENINKNMAITFRPENDSAEARYRHLYLAGAFYNVFIEWLKNGRQESCEEMAEICCRLTCDGCHIKKGTNENE